MNQSSSYDWTSWAERVLIGRFCTNILFSPGPSKHYRYYRFYRYYKHYRYYRRPVQPARKIDLPTYFSPPKSVRLAQDWKAPSVPRGRRVKIFQAIFGYILAKSGADLTAHRVTAKQHGSAAALSSRHIRVLSSCSSRVAASQHPVCTGRFMHSGGRLMKRLQVCR